MNKKWNWVGDFQKEEDGMPDFIPWPGHQELATLTRFSKPARPFLVPLRAEANKKHSLAARFPGICQPRATERVVLVGPGNSTPWGATSGVRISGAVKNTGSSLLVGRSHHGSFLSRLWVSVS
jgi:hypothetical protein